MNYKEQLAMIRPELGEKVGALFTERAGGVSSGPWGSIEGVMGLNVGSRVGDNAACVRMNRNIVSQLVPSAPRWMTQVHGVRVVRAEDVLDETEEADAQVTTVPGVVCTVQVADCLPVLLAAADGSVVGAAHAGWRSLAAGILERTVEEMRQAQESEAPLRAWLGPRIGAEAFEVDASVKDTFVARYGLVAGGVQEAGSGKWRISLAAFARAALESVGVNDINDCGLSTYADAQRFYSFRRDGQHTGRHAALIWIQ